MKHVMKLRLRKDGTWENVYHDGSSDQEFTQLSNNMLIKMQSKRLSEIASDYLEEAVEASGYKDAKLVIDHIRGLK
jgi:hypothetical protein